MTSTSSSACTSLAGRRRTARARLLQQDPSRGLTVEALLIVALTSLADAGPPTRRVASSSYATKSLSATGDSKGRRESAVWHASGA